MLNRILIEGFIYSIVLGAIITISQIYNARIWVGDYPQAIQEKTTKLTEKENKIRVLVGIPFLLIMFGYPLFSTLYLKHTMGSLYTFSHGFINSVLLIGIFNIFDLIILDWFIFCYLNPKFIVLEGTEGMKEYKDYKFHVHGFGIGLVLTLISSLIIAFISILV